MWKRSQVEQLTGLTRHMIQDLCNPNTAGDGLGFWQPAVFKPGYSRFDEGDLLAFYLVRQLMKAGFTLREVEPLVFDLMEEGPAFEEMLRAQESRLRRQERAIGEKLTALARLEDAAEKPVSNRLLAVMEASLLQGVDRVLVGVDASESDALQARAALVVLAGHLVSFLRGEQQAKPFERMRREVKQLVSTSATPGGSEAAACAASVARACESEALGIAAPASAPTTLRAFATFLAAPEHGVPIELVFGEGSFTLLAQAAKACARQDPHHGEKDGQS